MRIVPWLALVLALGVSVAAASPAAEHTELLAEYGPIQVGQPAPDFAGWDMDNQLVSFKNLFPPREADTRAVVITFFATWCAPCKEGLPTFVQFARESQAQGVRVIAVAVGEDVETVAPFLDGQGIDLFTLTDQFGTISRKFGLGGPGGSGSLPRTFVFDSKRTVRCIIGAEGRDLLDVLKREVAAARGEG